MDLVTINPPFSRSAGLINLKFCFEERKTIALFVLFCQGVYTLAKKLSS